MVVVMLVNFNTTAFHWFYTMHMAGTKHLLLVVG